MSEALADPAGRQRLREAIELQQEHFDMFGLQLGFTYQAGAIVPDGSETPARTSTTRDFVPTSRPGARVPHAWVERAGARVSVLDLLPYDRFEALLIEVEPGGGRTAPPRTQAFHEHPPGLFENGCIVARPGAPLPYYRPARGKS